jgi:transcription elongation factor Elf1
MAIDWLDIEWKCPYCGSDNWDSAPVIKEKDLVSVIKCGDCYCHYMIFNEELEYKIQENKLEGFPCQEDYEKPSKREEQEMRDEWEWERKRDESLFK